ncbi:hypothetical protein [Spongiactinospora sp. TRM90649]|uniref:hypothetical protein n=1 Tax=Spongiactinospora sp. TRM90649 TaxID=3031114 RepID=UPI0023FA3E11|nr:hypothetical protein [Spongiactinospora sp. TRM90649]MDF5751474.1 hypothetical protein [Spongiactinospora sp. TRM90649]
MSRIRRVTAVGAIAMFGVMGCSAEAGTGSPTPAATPTDAGASATPSGPGRQNITVRLNPDNVIEGEESTVWILANCPVPDGGPEHSGSATSDAFVRAVTLDPVPPPTPTASADGQSAPVPWVRGEAQVPSSIDAGRYNVDVRCEGTNDTGRARLRVAAESGDKDDDKGTVVPTKAPRAGGGGTAAGSEQDDSGLSPGLTAIILVVAVAGGAGLALVRRRRS